MSGCDTLTSQAVRKAAARVTTSPAPVQNVANRRPESRRSGAELHQLADFAVCYSIWRSPDANTRKTRAPKNATPAVTKKGAAKLPDSPDHVGMAGSDVQAIRREA